MAPCKEKCEIFQCPGVPPYVFSGIDKHEFSMLLKHIRSYSHALFYLLKKNKKNIKILVSE